MRPLSNILTAEYRHLNKVFRFDETETEKANSKQQLENICEVNDQYGEDMILVKLVESKVIQWLKKKVKKISAHFENQSHESQDYTTNEDDKPFIPGAQVPGFNMGVTKRAEAPNIEAENRSKKVDAELERECILMAIGFLSEYVSASWREKLFTEYETSLSEIMGKKKKESQKRTHTETRAGNSNEGDYSKYLNQAPIAKVSRQETIKPKTKKPKNKFFMSFYKKK
uniref:Ribonuclease H2 subunit B wHTH domain-containing protein n=1 Tax=Aplanochytrium stocchinoi TaxID=215587 RepID=A0A7S3PPH5_9STRA